MISTEVRLTARDGRTFAGYQSVPSEPRGPSIVVLQEIFGVNANIRATVDSLAAKGFLAIAPDIFWRQQPGVQLNPALEPDRDTATKLLKVLDTDLAVEDALCTLDHLCRLPGANGKRAAVGYCLGGKLAYLLAARTPIDAAVSYYGVGIQSVLEEAVGVRGKLLLFLAGDDHLCPPQAQAAIEAAVRPFADRITVSIFPGVGHAFARRGGSAFNEKMATKADAMSERHLAAALPCER